MKETLYTSVFAKEILEHTPLYYRFMNKFSKEELEKIELISVRRSYSPRHRSSSYISCEPYTPPTKFIPAKLMH
jgi:hypothetical protein